MLLWWKLHCIFPVNVHILSYVFIFPAASRQVCNRIGAALSVPICIVLRTVLQVLHQTHNAAPSGILRTLMCPRRLSFRENVGFFLSKCYGAKKDVLSTPILFSSIHRILTIFALPYIREESGTELTMVPLC